MDLHEAFALAMLVYQCLASLSGLPDGVCRSSIAIICSQ
ncbi:Unknown protein sequence [Pseudomonas coronafaciens pv. oryzae]|nr:Unknown protein sequence [Pseudomonas coronafaciens pv. oryzae]